ncbi:MAG: response regulator [Candidatus Omnitrophica bacterium]|nr:response regulator [Candidatus Omnitrophota bacterium]
MARILVVDDEETLCDFLGNFFLKKGCEVSKANNGEQALQAIDKSEPHMILLDMRMPGMSGMDVLRTLRERGQEIPVIALTAVDNDMVMDEAKQFGVIDYITKPFSLDQLEDLVLSRLAGLLG